MKAPKTTLKKYISYIKNAKKKVFTCDDLSKLTGDKVEKIKDYLVEYNPLIHFDYSFNLKEIVSDLENDLEELDKTPVKKRQITKKSDVDKYDGVLAYIYKNMTVAGGLLDVGYPLTKSDIKMLKKLLKKEEEKFKK